MSAVVCTSATSVAASNTEPGPVATSAGGASVASVAALSALAARSVPPKVSQLDPARAPEATANSSAPVDAGVECESGSSSQVHVKKSVFVSS